MPVTSTGKKLPYPKDKKSRSFISSKIEKLMHEGKKKDVAIATALSMARRMKSRKHMA